VDGAENVGHVVGRGADDRGEPEAVVTEEAQEAQEAQAPSLTGWVETHPRAVVVAFLVLSVPYLLVCVGIGLAFVSGMSGGTCG